MESKSPAPKRGAARPGAQASAAAIRARNDLQTSVEAAARKMLGERALIPGSIVFRDPSQEGPIFALRTSGKNAEITAEADSEPLLEISGDPKRLKAILEGRKDARQQFFAGGISIRGDMRYLSELGIALGFLKTPIV